MLTIARDSVLQLSVHRQVSRPSRSGRKPVPLLTPPCPKATSIAEPGLPDLSLCHLSPKCDRCKLQLWEANVILVAQQGHPTCPSKELVIPTFVSCDTAPPNPQSQVPRVQSKILPSLLRLPRSFCHEGGGGCGQATAECWELDDSSNSCCF